MRQYYVTGMSCAACSARVEKAVNALGGVTSCSVNLLTNSMGVVGEASDEEIIKAVENAGYGAGLKNSTDKNSTKNNNKNGDELADKETPKLKKRFLASVIFLIVLMYFSMGKMMFDFPVPTWLERNFVAMAMIQLILTIIIMVINQKFFVSGIKGIVKGAPNMDTLVALGASASFGYSVVILFLMTDALVNQNHEQLMRYMDDLYFESSATILTLITVGKMLEARSKGKTTDALKSLMKLAPSIANVERNGEVIEIPIDDVEVGDIFVVKPGESIPVDGVVIEGESVVDEAALTGESIPVNKNIADNVSAATINISGFMKCRAKRVGEDTTLSQIIKMVTDASSTKAPISKIADKVSGIFVPTVVAISIVAFTAWMIAGYGFSFSLSRAIAVLVISCPCALGLATPVAIMVANGVGAKNGILFKTAAALEETSKTAIVVLDKTGTITSGKPKVTDIFAEDEEELLKIAGSLEMKSEHPLALAVVDEVKERKVGLLEVTEFKAISGNGLKGKINGEIVYGGNARFIEEHIALSEKTKEIISSYSENGKTPMIFATKENFLGIIAVADTIKEDSKKAIEELKKMGMKVIMLTGDNEKTAKAIGEVVGVDEVIAGVLPDGKDEVIRKLKKNGKVIMVGDGINDAPALVRADIGIAIGAGTDVAIDAAEVVLMNSKLSDVLAAIRLSRATIKNIKENLFWAFIYNVIGIPLAAGVWYPLFGWKLNPMFGAAAMSLSSFCVVTNALRLNLLKIHDLKYDKKINTKVKNEEKEKKSMNKKMYVKGMMCGHCEARVKKVLEELPEVEEAIVSHEEGTAVLTLTAAIEDEVLVKTVTDQGYEVTGIE